MTGDTHKNHVGIGITRTSYNKLRKAAKKQKTSIRQLVDDIAALLDIENVHNVRSQA